MKNVVLLALLLSPISYAQGQSAGGPNIVEAGPSDGGGTNLIEDNLVDLVKFRETYGGKQYSVDPKKFRLGKDQPAIYEQIKPLLDRVDHLYPGSGKHLIGAFEKPWIFVEKNGFTPRAPGEEKVISQTKEAVFVSAPWVKKAKRDGRIDLIKEAFVHEAVRNLAHHLVRKLFQYQPYADLHERSDGYKQLMKMGEDKITEALTPPIYRSFPHSLLESTMRTALKEFVADNEKANQVTDGRSVDLVTRNDFYQQLKKLGMKPKETYQALCSGNEEKRKVNSEESQAMNETRAKRRPELTENLGVAKRFHGFGTPFANKDGDGGYVSLEPKLQEYLNFFEAASGFLTKNNSTLRRRNAVYKACGELKDDALFLSLIKEYQAAGGATQDSRKLLEEIPDDDGPVDFEKQAN